MNNKFDALTAEGGSDEEQHLSEESEGEVEAGPGEHALQYKHTFWFWRRGQTRQTNEDYQENLKRLATVASVEQFWRVYCHLQRPGEIQGHADIHLFKHGGRPVWEDEVNREGGQFIIRLRKGLVSRVWENLVLAMLGEQFMVGDEICGAVVSVRYKEDSVSLWCRHAGKEAITNRIRETLRRVLNLPDTIALEYKAHNDSLRDVASFRGPDKFTK